MTSAGYHRQRQNSRQGRKEGKSENAEWQKTGQGNTGSIKAGGDLMTPCLRPLCSRCGADWSATTVSRQQENYWCGPRVAVKWNYYVCVWGGGHSSCSACDDITAALTDCTADNVTMKWTQILHKYCLAYFLGSVKATLTYYHRPVFSQSYWQTNTPAGEHNSNIHSLLLMEKPSCFASDRGFTVINHCLCEHLQWLKTAR